ncbi:MAG: PEGA domain-containing protein [Woeseiaceae bacterium]|nr:PEGA domain-containing protein [Woeseiaceae bacterium]
MSFEELIIRDIDGERRFDGGRLPVRVGTGADCDVRLPGPGGSPVMQLDLLDGAPIVQPLGRNDAMSLNGESLVGSRRLSDGDELDYFGSTLKVTIGERVEFSVQLEASAYVTQPPEAPELTAGAEESIAPTAFKRAADKSAPAAELPQKPLKTVVGFGLAFLLAVSYLLFTSKSIQFSVTPGPADNIAVAGAWFKLPIGDRLLMRPGTYTVNVEKAGYYDISQSFEVGEEANKTIELELRRLPGKLTVQTSATDDVTVTINGSIVGPAPLGPVELQPGDHSVAVSSDRYLPYSDVISIEGLGMTSIMNVQLIPRWADVEITSEPAGAQVIADETLLGVTPLTIELLEGSHDLSVVADGFRAWDGTVVAEPDVAQVLPLIRLEPADAKLRVNSIPRGANVTVNGRYRGQSPITLDLSPGIDYEIGLTRAGYGRATRQVRLEPAASDTITVDMTARIGRLTVNVSPSDAQIFVDGRPRGTGSRTLELSSAPHRIEVRKDGYETWTRTLTPRPGYPQTVNASIRSLESIRQASIEREVKTSQDAVMRRVEPGTFSLGASRSEPGRRANEVIVPVTITNPFLIGTREVTNKEFREFSTSHDSGSDVHVSMAGDNNPVANVTWEQAVQYCNWLSTKEGLTPVYKEEFGKWVPIYPFPDGYRLPTEAEWVWAVRYAGTPGARRFSWGDRWPPQRDSGNFADKSAMELVPSVIPRYDDGFASTAAVGKFKPNALGLYDGAGNVAEWVNDLYTVPTPGLTTPVIDPVGPPRGNANVIRGSSWRHPSETELRLSYRESGTAARPDLGFRIARNLP